MGNSVFRDSIHLRISEIEAIGLEHRVPSKVCWTSSRHDPTFSSAYEDLRIVVLRS